MKKSMSLKEYFAILGVTPNSSLDDVKRAYRKRAFELHPDLNPSAGASQQFQRLNEAYVNLIRALDTQGKPPPTTNRAKPDASDAKTGHQAYAEQARREQQEKEQKEKERLRREKQEEERRKRQDAEQKLREKEEQEARDKREKERRERLRTEIERQEAERLARKEKNRLEQERLAQAREAAEKERQEKLAQQQPKAEAYKRSYAKPQGTADNSSFSGSFASANPSGNPSFDRAYGTHFTGMSADEPSRENLLNDLLNDPFARRVYEDIYAEVENRKNAYPTENLANSLPAERLAEVGKSAKDFAKNVGGAMKGWLHSQIDEVQEIAMPASSLCAGARIRLQIKVGLSGEGKTVDVTLPPDFAPGKPIRLRGMGRKVGKWQGDLFLIFKSK